MLNNMNILNLSGNEDEMELQDLEFDSGDELAQTDYAKDKAEQLWEKYNVGVKRFGVKIRICRNISKKEYSNLNENDISSLFDEVIDKLPPKTDKLNAIDLTNDVISGYFVDNEIKYGGIKDFKKEILNQIWRSVRGKYKSLQVVKSAEGYYVSITTNIIRHHLFQEDDITKLTELNKKVGIEKYLFLQHRGLELMSDVVMFLHNATLIRIKQFNPTDKRVRGAEQFLDYLSNEYVNTLGKDANDLKPNSAKFLLKLGIVTDRVGFRSADKDKNVTGVGQIQPYWRVKESVPYPKNPPKQWNNNTPQSVKDYFYEDRVNYESRQLMDCLRSVMESYKYYNRQKKIMLDKETYKKKITRKDNRDMQKYSKILDESLKRFIVYTAINALLPTSEKTKDGRNGYELTCRQLLSNLYFPHQSISVATGGIDVSEIVTSAFIPQNDASDSVYKATLNIIDSLVEKDIVYVQNITSHKAKTTGKKYLKGKLYTRTKRKTK